ncbi:hypothetical protein [Vreelandella sulfidaeris]|uniref:hypothetical protein n=1 Tax=Vreelandella sulfidaeris TaxID=115553 RepID=UPI0035EB1F5B
MTNAELARKREQLRQKADGIAGMNPLFAANEIKIAALLAAEITDELTRRELQRGEHE